MLNRMEPHYAGSTIRKAYITMGTMIKTTMDRYVHVTDESLDKAIRQFEACQPSVSAPNAQTCVKNA